MAHLTVFCLLWDYSLDWRYSYVLIFLCDHKVLEKGSDLLLNASSTVSRTVPCTCSLIKKPCGELIHITNKRTINNVGVSSHSQKNDKGNKRWKVNTGGRAIGKRGHRPQFALSDQPPPPPSVWPIVGDPIRGRKAWIRIKKAKGLALVSPLSSHVTLGKWLNSSEPQVSYMETNMWFAYHTEHWRRTSEYEKAQKL